MSIRPVLRRSLVPFLVLAEPFVFFLYEGGSYCQPICFHPTVGGVGSLVLLSFGVGFLAIALSTLMTRLSPVTVPWLSRLLNPSRLTSALLLGLFGAFLFFLTLDALSVPGMLWKPVVLPASFIPFLPVWGLYAATFPLAIVVGLLGVEFSHGATLVLRGIVLFGGFGLSAIWQAVLATVVSDVIDAR